MNEAADAAQQKLAGLLEKMGVSAEIEVLPSDPPLLNIKPEEPGSLIGHRGEGLRAMQHLVRLMLVRDGIESNVLVDIDGYRERQHQQLQEMAAKKADQVVQTGRLAVLQPMSSYERRLVHTALAERDDVITESLGEGRERRVMIKKADE